MFENILVQKKKEVKQISNIKRKIVKNIFGNVVEKLRKNAFIKPTEKMIYDVTAK